MQSSAARQSRIETADHTQQPVSGMLYRAGMQIGGITRAGVLQAIAEHKRLGVEKFRATYRFRSAAAYRLVHDGQEYDSKAIAGVAHQYDFGRALKPSEFSGGKDHAVAWLEREGFTVVKPPKTFLRRIGDVRPQTRRNGPAPHRPLLLLWAIGQAVAGAPREQPWSVARAALAPLLEKYGEVRDGRQAAHYPFLALVRDDLWVIAGDAHSALSSNQVHRHTAESLNRLDPKAGFPEEDFEFLQSHPEKAAEAAAGLLLRYFYPLPAGLLEDLGLTELLGGRWADSLRPLPGEQFKDREAIWSVYGGQKMAGIGYLADGILSVFSDDKGPYADGRLPDTGWISYVGDGLSGDQQLVDGNKMLAEYQAAQRPLRYWHKPFEQEFSFETWAIIVQRRYRWGRGDDGQWRREFLWILAPVPSPLRESWPADVIAALEDESGELYDETGDYEPGDVDPSERHHPESDQDAYRRLTDSAEASVARRSQSTRRSTADRYIRSASARAAVIRRSGGSCENPSCAGHPSELTTAGEPILQVDHIHDLGKGGADLPWNMIALCPNCHALKTYGANRDKLKRSLQKTALRLHDLAISSADESPL
ncbi:HNH endonuclease signature motif containing protein [Kitasatospora sp. NPDC051914]|uniref:HNH endonuclease signature motif containing protein n=1 Tax=Kitasatospora sp. NPDC051914 TaxID=3154945 RepID=UPI00342FD7D3